ncbi:unnamed protein product [marine sediment metagenome]|uniref:Uncharacterized protein n=1 Tax=marine sediment metagenome TaxID=412755 RepID=X0V2V5_9ZZZZ
MAGGIRISGRKKSIIIVSGTLTGTPKPRKVNLVRALTKEKPQKGIILQPNDVVYIPRTFIANLNQFWTDFQPTLDQGMAVFDWRDKIQAYHY